MPQPRCYENRALRQLAYRRRTAAARQAHLAAASLPPLPAIPTMPGHRRWEALVKLAQWALETARDEMQDYHDDRSEAWQESDAADTFNERIADVESALQAVDDL